MCKYSIIKNLLKTMAFSTLILTTLALTGCSGNVGIGMSVGVPVGDHGYVSVGTGTGRRGWY